MPLETLKVRAEFQRIRGGTRVSMPTFLIEAKMREAPRDRVDEPVTSVARKRETAGSGPRFGFTITKKIGGAVQRNRMRRRLKDAVGRLQSEFAKPGYDYVIVARGRSLDCPFDALVADVRSALVRVHRTGSASRSTSP
jgi:ribonuclease P protein component